MEIRHYISGGYASWARRDNPTDSPFYEKIFHYPFSTIGTSGCPGLDVEGVCLYVPFPEDRLPWRQAEARCNGVGGTLAAVTSSAVHSRLTSLLMQQGIEEVWVGGNETEHMWRWISGKCCTDCIFTNLLNVCQPV